MISIYLGLPGSGKTLSAVREMHLNRNNRLTYTNIIPKNPELMPNVKTISSDMIITKEVLGYNRAGEEKVKLSFNAEFWKNQKEPINVVIDEAHTILNSRASMTKVNRIMGDFLSLVRRTLGASESSSGQLIFISQLAKRIDVIAREMATNIRYYVCHWKKSCLKCRLSWAENSQLPEPRDKCPRCGDYDLKKSNHIIEAYHFSSMDHYQLWADYKMKTFYRHYYIKDVETYFKFYDTLQWENLISEVY